MAAGSRKGRSLTWWFGALTIHAPRWLALSVGAAADVAVLERLEGMFDFVDNYEKRTGPQRLFPVAALIGGERVPSRA